VSEETRNLRGNPWQPLATLSLPYYSDDIPTGHVFYNIVGSSRTRSLVRVSATGWKPHSIVAALWRLVTSFLVNFTEQGYADRYKKTVRA
jgi:hypothetical protein